MNKDSIVPFIGREHELSKIDNWINEKGTYQAVCIEAPGGFGKTRLLQEVYKLYVGKHDDIFIAHIIDFDDHSLHVPENFRFMMAERIGLEHFDNYLQKLQYYRAIESESFNLEKLEQDVQEAWNHDFNIISAEQRVIYLLDTTDALTKTDIFNYLIALLSSGQLNNVLFLVAGRNTGEIYKLLHIKIGDDVQHINLPPLEEDEKENYLKQKQSLLLITIEPELARKILFLSGGKPIIIDLAIEWQSGGSGLDWLFETSLDELQSLPDVQMEKRQEEFERQLVLNIVQTRHKMDWMVLAMSHVYPLNKILIAKLLNLSADEVNDLLKKAGTSSFVKSLPTGEISLHDEMRRMINEYVWPEIDPAEDHRHEYSQIATAHYENEVLNIEKQITELKKEDSGKLEIFLKKEIVFSKREAAIISWVRHAMISDIENGFSAYKDAVWKARDERRHRFAKKLEETVQPHIPRLNPDQQYEFNMLHGRLLNDRRIVQEAKKLFEQLLDGNQGKLEREADIHNALSVSEINLGNYEVALKHQQKSFSIIKWLNKEEYYSRVANKLGDIYKLRGEFKESLQYYRAALDAELQADSPDRNSVASILNNMGYVFGLEGEYNEGERFCQQAIDMWIYENLSEKAGEGEIALSTIFRDKGEYNNAITYLRKAVTRFKEPDDAPWLVRAYLHSGWTQWYHSLEIGESDDIRIVKKSFEKDIKRARRKRSLHLARDSFEKSLELAEKYHVHAELPLILGKYSNVCWLLDEKEKARRLINEAFELSKEYNDIYQAIDSLLVMAEFDYTEGKYDKIPDYARILQDEYESKGYSYPLLFGRMRRFLADIAYKAYDHDNALHKYAEGIALINQHGGYSMYSIDYELESLKNKLDTLPAVKAYEWITHLKTYWKGKKPGEKYVALLNWCDQQLIETKFRER
ncbi:MAG: tetratricopeptide repeat protein [Desulfobacteraceae bacterium]|nr:tetratricopeptide repeat protein [Desulfobacteraceae bacterium]